MQMTPRHPYELNVHDAAEHQEFIDGRRKERMRQIDNLTPELRILVHDYGWNCVRAFLDCGVVRPKRIRHLVETVLNEFSPTRGAYSNQGIRTTLKISAKTAALLEQNE